MSLLHANLEAFAAVARHQTVHAAARELGLTQTGVTQRLRALERSLSTTLFLRSRRGMRLTPEGEALLHYCHATRDLEGEALARIEGAGLRTEVRVTLVGPSSIMRSRVVPSAAPIARDWPHLALSFELRDPESRVELLRAGQAQLAIVEPRLVAREMDSKRLKPERYVLVAPPAWRGRRLADLVRDERIIDFDQSDTMTHSYLAKFGLAADARSERHFVNNTESLVTLIAAGLGYGVLTTEFAQPFLKRGELVLLNSGSALEHPLAAAWYPRTTMPPYLAAMIKALH